MAASRPALAAPSEDVSLKSLGLAVLSYVVQAVTADNVDVLAPAIKELAEYASSLPPRALFDNWAPGSERHALPLILDGSYTSDLVGAAVDGGAAVACLASSEKAGDKNPALQAIQSDKQSWISAADATNSWWQVRLAAPTYVQHLKIQWRVDASAKSLPETYTISTSQDGTTWTPIGPATALDSLDKAAMSSQRVAVDAVTQYVRVDMAGYAKNTPAELEKSKSTSTSKDKAHAIERFELHVPDTLSIHVAPGSTLYDLEKMLTNAATGSVDSSLVAAAIGGLQSLALASGSAQGMLKLVSSLVALQAKASSLSAGAAAIPDRFKALASGSTASSIRPEAALGLVTLPTSLTSGQLVSFARGLDEACNEELESLLSGKLTSTGGGGGSAKIAPKFDRDCCTSSSSWDFTNDDTWVKSTTGSRICVYGTVGFSAGRVAWEFKSEQDSSGDEYLCYGCGIKPKSGDAYDSSSNLWMIRGYNGRVHQKGSSGRQVGKIKQGNVVRFELDSAAGTVQCFIDGEDQGIVFDNGLEGQEVFPAVCSYGSGRTASFQAVEVLSGPAPASATAGGAAATSAAYVSLPALPALSTGNKETKEVSSGHYFANGVLEEGDGDVKIPIIVAGEKQGGGLSLRPDISSGSPASVTFPLAVLKADESSGDKDKAKGGKKEDKTHKPYDYLVARLGVDDTSIPPEFQGVGSSRPVVIAISLDGKEVYASGPLASPGETHFVRLPIKDAGKLTLTARFAADPAGYTPPASRVAAKAVICAAAVIPARDWAWTSRRAGSLPSFLDSTATTSAAATTDGVIAAPTSPLSMARLILSRLAFLAEAHNEVSRRGAAALLKIARACGLDNTAASPAEVAQAGAAYLAAAAAKAKSKKKDASSKAAAEEPEAFTQAELDTVIMLRRLQTPFCLDVCAATFSLLTGLISSVLPHVWAENGDLTTADIPSGPLSDADEAALSAKRPWTALARYLLTITRAHLRRLVTSGVEPASVGIFVAGGSSAAAGGAGEDSAATTALSPVEAAAAALRAAIAADLTSRGDVASSHARTASGVSALVSGDASKSARGAVEGIFRLSAPGAFKESTLAPVHRLLQFIIEDEEADLLARTGGKATILRSRLPPYLQSSAADAIDAGLSVLYPTQAERRALLSGLISKGGVLEVQFRFPATRTDAVATQAIATAAAMKKGDDKDKKASSSSSAEEKKKKEEREKAADALVRKMTRDPRPDRAMLLLQMECDRLGLPVFVYGSYGSYVHAIVDLSGSSKAVEFLDAGFASVFERAGLGKWTIPTGCTEPSVPLKIERIVDFSSPDRTFSEGVGLVRIYPHSAASFDDISTGVQGLVAGYTGGVTVGAAMEGGGAAGGAAAEAKSGGAKAAATGPRKGGPSGGRRVLAVAR